MVYPNKVMVVRAPLGLGYIASYLKQSGHEMKLFDTTFMKCSDTLGDDELRAKLLQVENPDILNYNVQVNNVFDELEKNINEYEPDIIGVSVVDPNYNFGLEIMRHCKKMFSNIPIIVGGPLTSFIPDEIIKEDCVDAIGIGECENAIVNFCNKLESGGWDNTFYVENFWVKDKNNIIHKNKSMLFDSEFCIAPSLDIYDERHFSRPMAGKMYKMASVIWTRGCIFNCSYCANDNLRKLTNKNPVEYYRISNVNKFIMDLKVIKEKYKLEFIMFVDDIWPLHKPELVREFCDLYKKHINLPFHINVHCKIVKEESFEMAVDAGLRNISIGVESGNSYIRKNILNRSYTNEDLQKVFNLAHKYKIRSSSFNIIGLPEETRENIMETIELNRKLNPDSATVTIFHPYRGCSLREKCIKMGYIDNKDNKYEEVYRSESLLNMPQLSKEEIINLLNSFQLYLKLPKDMYETIKKQENDTPESLDIRNNIVLPIFNKIRQQESKWDFNKKENWWTL